LSLNFAYVIHFLFQLNISCVRSHLLKKKFEPRKKIICVKPHLSKERLNYSKKEY
jgi:hypothetical protein